MSTMGCNRAKLAIAAARSLESPSTKKLFEQRLYRIESFSHLYSLSRMVFSFLRGYSFGPPAAGREGGERVGGHPRTPGH
ncbi:MAG TPA: hypothetical protein VKX46_00115, partial [Ktedonobacteraceae bacterium]|nr:hypothetical protein [Ktedonobacteraceae bacterium]